MLAVITGASKGIGLETAKLLCKKGWKVYGLSRSKSEWQDDNFVQLECDVASMDSLEKAKQQIKEPIDLLVLNAGIYFKNSVSLIKEEEFDKMFAVNIRGVFLTVKTFLEGMLERGKGNVVAISSKVGTQANSGAPEYVATKHGVEGFIKSLRPKCAEKGVKLSLVCPGGVDTPTFRGYEKKDYLDPKEVAECVLFITERKRNTVIDRIFLEPVVHAIDG